VIIWAAGGALIAIVAICATVTGLLAPVGAAIGVIATLASLIGLRTTGRHLAGHGLAIVGVLVGLTAIVIGAFAATWHVGTEVSGSRPRTPSGRPMKDSRVASLVGVDGSAHVRKKL
jgi:hypothetical protein